MIVEIGPLVSVEPYNSAMNRPNDSKYFFVDSRIGAAPLTLEVWLSRVLSRPNFWYILLIN
jgi:hypothetical protein